MLLDDGGVTGDPSFNIPTGVCVCVCVRVRVCERLLYQLFTMKSKKIVNWFSRGKGK